MSELKTALMKVSSNPHIRSKISTSKIMLAVIIALLPTTIFGVWNFGFHALLLVLVTIASTVLTEALYEVIMKKKLTITDFSAVVTGILLALNLPPNAPLWIGVMGGVLMASVGLLGTILGFSAEMTALLMAIYLALDGYGPACNVSGDGAIAIVMNKLFGKK